MASAPRSTLFGAVAAAETHLSMLFFTPDRVLKLLKPVDAGFVSFVDRDARLAAALREFECNQRISPDVYLGTADLIEDGEVVDRLILMRRLPDDRQLHRLASEPSFDRRVGESARFIAAFHSSLTPITGPRAEVASADRVRSNWQDNLDTIRPLVGPVLAAAAFEEVEQLVTDYLAGRHTLFEERIQGGRIVDGHGDLRAEHIFCLDDGPRVIDCLAFRDDYRAGDVLADIAFLAMDLHRLVGPEAAAELVRSYDEFSNEHHPSSLAHHYVAYRAHVRAKVAAVRFQQGDRDAAAEVETYHALALEHLRAARVHLILVGGGAGVGKSTVAEGLARELGAVWLRSDEVRKSTAGIPVDEHRFEAPGEGIYAPEVTGEVYQQLLDQAEGLLTRGQSVVLDATWAAEGHRTMARQLAERTSSTVTELRCAAPLALAKERIARRMASLDEPSDATPEIAQFLADRFEAWPDAHTIDTSGSIADSITAACAVVTEPPDRPERPDVVTLSGAASMRVESIRFFLSRRRTLQQPRPSRPSVFDPTRDVDRR